MNSSEEQKGAGAPGTGGTPSAEEPTPPAEYTDAYPHEPDIADPPPSAPPVTVAPPESASVPARTTPASDKRSGGGKPPEPPSGGDGNGGDEDDYMLRMSFLEHLEELRSRIIRALMGVAVAFGVSIFFTDKLWD